MINERSTRRWDLEPQTWWGFAQRTWWKLTPPTRRPGLTPEQNRQGILTLVASQAIPKPTQRRGPSSSSHSRWCYSPIDESRYSSIVRWVQKGFEDLGCFPFLASWGLGLPPQREWSGVVSFNSPQLPSHLPTL